MPNYEDIYEVSSYGRLKSLERDVDKGDVVQHRKERIKKQWPNPDGYLQCKLSKDGTNVNVGVHRVVAMAFLDNPDNKQEVNHKDGNRQNNCVSNLEWVTRLENIEDCFRRGTHVSFRDTSGVKNPNYGNRKLHEKYKNDPELAATIQSRPGCQNGRAIPISLTLPDGKRMEFHYIGECGKWLIDNNWVKIKLASINLVIKKCATNHTSYHGLWFEFT